MPIYEYQCSGCEHRFEELQKISDPILVKCPVCQEPKLKKLVSAAGFRLKGSGWYETDFKSNNKKNLADSPSSGKSEGSNSSDKGSTESKTTTKDAGSAKPSSGSSTGSSSGKGSSSTKSSSTD
jgi:putative FmdB family regulatory protein